MKKFTFIGAGSFGFTRELVKDILTFPAFNDAIISLMDIDEERLSRIEQACVRIRDEMKSKAVIEATTDRISALEGSDGVIITILNGGPSVFRTDIEIPARYGVDICVGDTRGPAGIFRFLRTAPTMLEICRDIERICPDAYVLNYTNPMGLLCRFLQEQTNLKITGLCHSVQETSEMLARWIGADIDDVDYTCVGINHQAFYTSYEVDGVDAYPLIKKAMENPEVYNEEQVRNELFLHLGYYPTESSGHNSEYYPWFRKRLDLLEKYCRHSTGWNPGAHAYILNEYFAREKSWKSDIDIWFAADKIKIDRGHEYAAYIFNALFGDNESFTFNGNMRNFGYVENLLEGACVEIPVKASKEGLIAQKTGKLPLHLATIINHAVGSEELAVRGAINRDKNDIFHAILCDPLTSAVLSMTEIQNMVNEMFYANKNLLNF